MKRAGTEVIGTVSRKVARSKQPAHLTGGLVRISVFVHGINPDNPGTRSTKWVTLYFLRQGKVGLE